MNEEGVGPAVGGGDENLLFDQIITTGIPAPEGRGRTARQCRAGPERRELAAREPATAKLASSASEVNSSHM
ncbi:hypothetical protein Poly30_13280 [Planctomycetes bacterium Poly30]|uniref:Uncharacterized protein n=1 Tax=Saltatorellus ferox TaxID=2528018 RepID=A0A518EP20_9BACT|nr:hypothetical protein Poly30_13280 [Planctomycetes bacterium Poly30]